MPVDSDDNSEGLAISQTVKDETVKNEHCSLL
jgi:hypothetical protein